MSPNFGQFDIGLHNVRNAYHQNLLEFWIITKYGQEYSKNWNCKLSSKMLKKYWPVCLSINNVSVDLVEEINVRHIDMQKLY